MAAVPPIPREEDLYDEAGYLRLYPGLAEAIAAGTESTAWRHFDKHGKREGRRPNDVDAEYYLATYPQVAAEIAAGRAADAAEHYIKWGRARGWLPNGTVARDVAPAMPPVFPFLWTDLPHAMDLIEGRVALGRLTKRQATLLRRWVRDGFVVLERKIDRAVLDAAALDLERGFAGASSSLVFLCSALSDTQMPWQPELVPLPSTSLDPHFRSRAIRDLAFADPIAEFLGLIFDAPLLVAHSRGHLRAGPVETQRAITAPAFTLGRQCACAWIPLEDAADDAGTLHHFAGSQRFPHVPTDALERRITELGLAPDRFVAAAGQAVIRHADLVHGGTGGDALATRRAVQVFYCPSFVAPTFVEATTTRVWRQEHHMFLTQYYPDAEPAD